MGCVWRGTRKTGGGECGRADTSVIRERPRARGEKERRAVGPAPAPSLQQLEQAAEREGVGYGLSLIHI